MMIRSNFARRAAFFAATTAALAMALQASPARAESGWGLLNMTQGVTEMSRRIYDLHMLIFWICVIIGVVVFGAMFWSIIFYRKSQGAVADTTIVHNTKVEIVWTAVPVIIMIAMAVPAAAQSLSAPGPTPGAQQFGGSVSVTTHGTNAFGISAGVNRLSDRLFVGPPLNNNAGNSLAGDGQNDWLSLAIPTTVDTAMLTAITMPGANRFPLRATIFHWWIAFLNRS